MKKVLLLTLNILFILFSQSTFANLVESDYKYGDLTFHCYRPIYTTEQSCYLIKCEKYATEVEVPSYVYWNGDKTWLTSIRDTAFLNCTALTTATIEFSREYFSIGDRCFENCTSLQSLLLPYGTYISFGKKVFANCSKLKSISINDNFTRFSGDSAFYGSSISEPIFNSKYFFHLPTTKSGTYSIPSGVTTIGQYAFQDCHDITEIVIPNTVTTIEDYAFKNCTGLTSITFPPSVQEVSSTAFVGCTNMSVTGSTETMTWSLKNGTLSINCTGLITSTPWDAFAPFIKNIHATGTDDSIGYWSLIDGVLTVSALEDSNNDPWRKLKSYITSIVLKNGVDIIPAEAFLDYSNIHSISMSSTITTIRDKAFYNCSSLTSFTMPNSVDSVGKAVFYGCNALENIVLSDNITSLSTDYYKTSSSWGTYEYYYGFFGNCSSLKSIVIPNNIKKIGDKTFYDCQNLNAIEIGSSVTSIGERVFEGCSSLSSIKWNSKHYPNSENNSGYYSPFYDVHSQITSLQIGQDVEHIPSYLFSQMVNITSIDIPNNVKSIGTSAFSSCSRLYSVNIANSVNRIGASAFAGTYWYETIVPDGVVYINNVLYTYKGNMPYNTSINIREGTTSITSNAFYRCHGLTSISIPDGLMSIGDEVFYECSSLSEITIPNSVTEIGQTVFYGCSSLESVVLSEKILSISSFSNTGSNYYYSYGFFEGCSSLKSIELPNNLQTIGDEVFRDCSSLEKIVIPNTVTNVGRGVFNGCTSLKSVQLSNNITSLLSTTYDRSYGYCGFFENCSSLTSITLPDSLKTIGEYAFVSCSSLKDITFGYNIPQIDDYAFWKCDSLMSITYPTNVFIHDSVYTLGVNTINVKANNWKEFCEGNVHKELNYNNRYNIHKYINDQEIEGDIVIPNGVTTIEDYAFYNCDLTSVVIPNSITNVGIAAFGSYKLTNATCYAQLPPEIKKNNFGSYYYQDTLYVPKESFDAYFMSEWFNYFNVILPISAKNTETTTDIMFELGENNDIIITWQSNPNAKYYTIVISKDGVTVCTLVFNSQGLLNNVVYSAPNRSGEHRTIQHATQTKSGYQFTITGLEADTDYEYTLTVTDINNSTLQEYSGTFDTYTKYIVELLCDTMQGDVVGAGTYRHNDTVSITAIPNAGYEFQEWSNGVTDNPYSFVVIDDITLKAEFVPITYMIEVTYQLEQGNVIGAGIYQYGDTVILTAQAWEGYEFKQWSNGVEDNPYSFVATENIILEAEFVPITYMIEVTYQPEQGNVIGAGIYQYGDTVILTAQALERYEFKQWSNGVEDNPYSFVATEDIILEAEFIPITAIENINAEEIEDIKKVIHNGQLLILRNGKIYNVMGQEM